MRRTVTSVAYEAATLKIHYLGFYPEFFLTLSAALEIPVQLVAIVSAARLGRRTSHATVLFCAGVACFAGLTLRDGRLWD